MLEKSKKSNHDHMLEKPKKSKQSNDEPVNGDIPNEKVVISKPKFRYATVLVRGTAPFLSNAMSSAARGKMRAAQLEGSMQRKINKKRLPKDFEAIFQGSLHISAEGWYGITCASFRNAMIKACSTVDFAMTRAKLFIFIEPDGYSLVGDALTRIYHGNDDPKQDERPGKLSTGATDILTRARFDKWECKVKIKWDSEALSATDIVNLLARAGEHVGVGAGRPGSRDSTGIGMGTFEVIS